MVKSIIVWANDLPGIVLDEDIVHPEPVEEKEETPEALNWWKSVAYAVLYMVGNNSEWDDEPAVKITPSIKYSAITGKVRNPSPWIEVANLSFTIQEKEDEGFDCKLWFEDKEISPNPLEREWFCYAPKDEGPQERISRLLKSLRGGITNAFTDYKPVIFS